MYFERFTLELVSTANYERMVWWRSALTYHQCDLGSISGVVCG